jgi:type III pantothenate kinase
LNLTIDIGNTRTKLGIFNKNNMLEVIAYENINKISLDELIISKNIEKSIISTTTTINKEIKKCTQIIPQNIYLNEDTPLPFINKYVTQNTLGKDRMALIAAAQQLFPKQNTLVIGCGTCITFNFINSKNQFLGGSIHPGLKMRLKAMNYFTKKLPLIEIQKSKKIIGKNTEENLIIGSSMATAKEIDAMIEAYKVKFPKLNIIITGGDADFLVSLLKNKIFAIPNLTLIGLNHILEYNA